MHNSSCVRCRAARAGGYMNGCNVHRDMVAPTVVVEHHRPTVVVVEDCDGPGLFVDSSGHLSENLGGGIGVDLVTVI